MRYELEFSIEKKQLPISYREIFVSFFKRGMEKNGKELYEQYYGIGKTKPITWSVSLPFPKFEKDRIFLGKGTIRLLLQINGMETSLHYLNACLGMKSIPFSLPEGNSMTLNRIQMINTEKVKGNIVEVKFYSPLCVRDHNRETNRDWYFSVESDEFESKLKENMKRHTEEGLIKHIDGLQIDFSNMRKTIIKIYDQNIESSIGKMLLIGNPKLINYFLEDGLGSRKASGFGLIQKLNEWEVSL